MTVVAIVEQVAGTPRKVALEVCSEAVRIAAALGTEAVGLAIGPGAAEALQGIGRVGVPRAIALGGGALEAYSGEAYAMAIADTLKDLGSSVALFGATSFARDLLGRVGVHLDVAPASDCTSLSVESGSVRIIRPVFAGKALLTLHSTRSPVLASLRPNTFVISESDSVSCAVESRTFDAAPERCARLLETVKSENSGRVDLGDAEIVVSGGRGLKDPETFTRLLEPLADALGAAIGASRAVVDAGWRPHSEQVGQTGKTVAPKLYFACGISGMIQHLAGMRTSRTIVAINKDPNAPIFKVADYGIVGDVEEVVPALTEQVAGYRQQ